MGGAGGRKYYFQNETGHRQYENPSIHGKVEPKQAISEDAILPLSQILSDLSIDDLKLERNRLKNKLKEMLYGPDSNADEPEAERLGQRIIELDLSITRLENPDCGL